MANVESTCGKEPIDYDFEQNAEYTSFISCLPSAETLQMSSFACSSEDLGMNEKANFSQPLEMFTEPQQTFQLAESEAHKYSPDNVQGNSMHDHRDDEEDTYRNSSNQDDNVHMSLAVPNSDRELSSKKALPEAEKHGISWDEILQIQNLIERCLQQHLSKDEIIFSLQMQTQIPPSMTRMVWEKLEEQNSDFFKAYAFQSQLKEQILAFNYLVYQQTQLMEKQKAQGLNGHAQCAMYAAEGTRDDYLVHAFAPATMTLSSSISPTSSSILNDIASQSFLPSPTTYPAHSPIKTELDTHAFFT